MAMLPREEDAWAAQGGACGAQAQKKSAIFLKLSITKKNANLLN